jgi:hypothetical protein
MKAIIIIYKKFSKLLKGKKTSIAMLIGATIAWLQYYGKINEADARLIMTIAFALGLGINYSDYRVRKAGKAK